jgi:hypothetical protein
VISNADVADVNREVTARFPTAARIDVREATLREVFVALARQGMPGARQEAAA